MATHPDKNHGAAGALQASQRVNAANDTLSDIVRRRQYGAWGCGQYGAWGCRQYGAWGCRQYGAWGCRLRGIVK
jgi:curved DNA-binding protein CbpA